jgi:chloramphenicol 3-O phosphotransferase
VTVRLPYSSEDDHSLMAGAAPGRLGTIILLNGTSCSGKTSLVRALQERLETPYLHVGLDAFEAMQPRKQGRRVQMVYGQGVRAPDLVHVLHVTSAAFAAAGADQILEHIFLRRAWLKDAVSRLARYSVWFVGVQCPLDELERRELVREGVQTGQCARQFRQLAGLHALAPYDLVVDTTTASPEVLADRIRRRLEAGESPTAFRRLRESSILDEPDTQR